MTQSTATPTEPILSASPLRAMVTLALPVAIGYLGQLSMQLVDTLVVGHISAVALGGVALGTSIFSFFMVVGFGLLAGMDFLASHAYGAGDHARARRIFLQAALLALVLSVPLGAVPIFLAFNLHIFGATPDVIAVGRPFLAIVSATMPLLLPFMACRQYLQCLGVAKPSTYILIAANVINLVANLGLALGYFGMPNLGVTGSALATLISRVFTLVAILAFLFNYDRQLWPAIKRLRVDWDIMKEILRLGAPASMQMILEVGAFAGSTTIISRLGAVPLAAHQIVLQIASFTFMVPLGISSATTVLVAQRLGAGDTHAARLSGWMGFAFGAGFMLLSGITLYLASAPILSVFTEDADVILAAQVVLPLAALFQLADGVQVVGSGALRGVADTRTPMVANFVGHWLLGLPVGITLCFYAGVGLRGLWMGLALGLAAVASLLLFAWWRKARTMTAGVL